MVAGRMVIGNDMQHIFDMHAGVAAQLLSSRAWLSAKLQRK